MQCGGQKLRFVIQMRYVETKMRFSLTFPALQGPGPGPYGPIRAHMGPSGPYGPKNQKTNRCLFKT